MKPYIFPSSIETARALILHLVKLMLDEPDRTFCIAFSGGSTPALMFDLWANEYTDITPWERLKVFWVDERCVPPENSDSNYGMMRSLLLSIVPIPYENVFRIQGEKNPKKEAARYSKLVMKEVPVENEFPVFDVVLLGAGNDGHTSSIFPGQEELLSTDHIYEANFNPNNGQKENSFDRTSDFECSKDYLPDNRKGEKSGCRRYLLFGRYRTGRLYSASCR